LRYRQRRWSAACACRAFSPHAREETPESRGMPCLFLNTERSFGGKPPKKSGFRRHLAGSKMPKETFFTAISRWRVVSRRALERDLDDPQTPKMRAEDLCFVTVRGDRR